MHWPVHVFCMHYMSLNRSYKWPVVEQMVLLPWVDFVSGSGGDALILGFPLTPHPWDIIFSVVPER